MVCGCGQDGVATTTEMRGGVECRGRGGVPGVSSGAIVPWSRNYIHHNNHHNWDNNAPGPLQISLASMATSLSLLSIFNISPIM